MVQFCGLRPDVDFDIGSGNFNLTPLSLTIAPAASDVSDVAKILAAAEVFLHEFKVDFGVSSWIRRTALRPRSELSN